MPVNWTNNSNDGQSADIITFLINNGSDEAIGQTVITVDDFDQTDTDGVGHPNWKVGDKFTITNDSTNTLHEITAIGFTGAGGDITITPALVEAAVDDEVCTKEDSYKGNQGSAERHLRLRNQGII